MHNEGRRTERKRETQYYHYLQISLGHSKHKHMNIINISINISFPALHGQTPQVNLPILSITPPPPTPLSLTHLLHSLGPLNHTIKMIKAKLAAEKTRNNPLPPRDTRKADAVIAQPLHKHERLDAVRAVQQVEKSVLRPPQRLGDRRRQRLREAWRRRRGEGA